MVIGSNILAGSSGQGGAYEIEQSIRFNDNDSAYLNRTPSSDGNRQTMTFSWWMKRGNLDITDCRIFTARDSNDDQINFKDTSNYNRLDVFFDGTSGGRLITAQVFKDVSAWYHCVVAIDTTQSTAGDRVKIYVNGDRVTDFDTETQPSLNKNLNGFNNNGAHAIGARAWSGAAGFYDGYLAEIVFIDGQQLAPTSFGETNSDTGQWVPIDVSGLTFGSNGYYLKGQDSSALGDDSSGNGNDFTSNNLTAADQVSDSPTSNHCTLNPLWIDGYTLSDGNLVTNQSGDAAAIGTMAFDPTDSDGFYFEAKVTTAATYPNVGIRTAESPSLIGAVSGLSGNSTGRFSYTGSNGQFNDEGSGSSYGDAWSGTADKVIGVLVKAGSLYFSVDGTIQNSGTAAKTGLTGLMVPTVFYDAGSGTQAAWEMRFDASDWSTTPSGYKALSTANLPDPTIADPSAYFQTTLYTGDGVGSGSGGQEIDQSGNSTFKPDFVWNRVRNLGTETHCLQDVVRGASKRLQSNSNAAENTETEGLLSFDSDGFTVGSRDPYNKNTATYVGWQWLADNTTGSSNTDGDITSTVSANTTSGFSVLTYSGNGSDNQEIGHGLGIAPKMIWTKRLDTTGGWTAYHDAVGINKVFYLNSSSLPASNTEQYRAVPTSSVYTVGVGGDINNSSGTYVAYVFAEVDGFSKAGSYKANASTDGPFVACGFAPAWVIFFSIAGSGAGRWMLDTVRSPFNVADDIVQANSSAAESSGSSYNLDFLSNGFKIRTSSDFNSSGRTIAFMAFAESPFKTATAR